MKNLMIVLILTFGLVACDGGGGGFDTTTIQTSITSGTVVSGTKPEPTNSQDSPVIGIIAYENAARYLLPIGINFSDSDGNVRDVIIAEKGKSKYNVIPANAGGIYNGNTTLYVDLSDSLRMGITIEFDIGLVDDYDNVSNYQSISVLLTEDSNYGITAYSGDSPPNISGTWNMKRTVTEPNPLVSVGTIMEGQVTISQSGNDIILIDETGSYSGTISGNSNFITVAINGTMDATSRGIDLYADFQNTLSGRIIDNDTVEGESNTIITNQHGDDINLYRFYSLSGDVVVTRVGSSGGGNGENENLFSTATLISIGTVYNKEIDSSTDVDVFAVVISSRGTIVITLTGLSDNLEMGLFDSGQTYLGDSANLGSNDERMELELNNTGVYYIVIIGSQGATSSYNLKVNFAEENGSGSTSITLSATADTYVSDGSNYLANYGDARGLHTGSWDGGTYVSNQRAFVKFDLSNIPLTSNITQATLYLRTSNNSIPCGRATTGTVAISEVMGNNWTENGLTYLNMPSSYNWITSRSGLIVDDCSSHLHNFDVTEAVNHWIDSNWVWNLGLSIKSGNFWNNYYQNDAANGAVFYSREVSQGTGPTLVVEYTN